MYVYACVYGCVCLYLCDVCERAFTNLLGESKIRILVIFFWLFITNFWGFLFLLANCATL